MKKMIRIAFLLSLLAGLLLAVAGCQEPARPIIACIEAEPTIGYAPLTVTFDAACSYVPPKHAGIYAFSWDFDDGTGDVGRAVAHTFAAPGTYAVSVGMLDEGGIPVAGTMRIVTILPVP
jgi:PKD repeat protein